ncbi:RNA polymerase sigma factor [Microbacterium ureisolvens]|uniref:RNA polymerase sigma factor n=1 Tax=Microbacterium ureisolvens TaxID=2781186 RepID=UPI003630F5C9
MTDREIWARVLAGEARAFGSVWDRHRDRVFRHLVGAGAASAEAEDLTAVVFLELWRRRDRVRFVDGSALPWLLVTAQNVQRNAVRARRRHRALLDRLPLPDAAPDPADLVAERDSSRTRLVREVMAATRPADRDLAMLTAVEGFTIREAAEAIGISESAAKMRLSRLRTRLDQAARAAALTEGGTP